ncbi:protein disulfide-isomerase [Pedobacter cryoconitis]|uniref:Protein disulfide-isomerase n=1 Tax=Pedobacter cryoconitis TaxID=188932 RepID=A0A7W8ZPY4_9SPHI|nr:DsbA family oxidoreductase [Pedobacter cryoconitis]MBB5638043.1 protein disulfide-isomerase [Pedobacter cryoconitis]
MKVDIWSDVNCPFCYIGKRKFELALEQFEHKDQVEIEWHSFELDPNAETRPGLNAYDYLAEKKGQSREWSVQMHQQVIGAAAEVGLEFDFDKVIIANSFNAHRLIQLAKAKGLDNEVEEQLFIAHFTAGKNIDDHAVLVETGKAAGLAQADIETLLAGDTFTSEVRADEQIAQQIGISGVPFFILDQKLAVSGAQPPSTFLGALEQAWTKSQAEV